MNGLVIIVLKNHDIHILHSAATGFWPFNYNKNFKFFNVTQTGSAGILRAFRNRREG
jgi:hypothetical protein